MKTQNEILTDFIHVTQSTPINDLNGGIYKKIRPTDSQLEDCVLSLITGTNAKFVRSATLIVKIFYKDVELNNAYYEDNLNGQAKEQLLIDLSQELKNKTGYAFYFQSRETYTEKVEDEHVHQHYAVLRINFQV